MDRISGRYRERASGIAGLPPKFPAGRRPAPLPPARATNHATTRDHLKTTPQDGTHGHDERDRGPARAAPAGDGGRGVRRAGDRGQRRVPAEGLRPLLRRLAPARRHRLPRRLPRQAAGAPHGPRRPGRMGEGAGRRPRHARRARQGRRHRGRGARGGARGRTDRGGRPRRHPAGGRRRPPARPPSRRHDRGRDGPGRGALVHPVGGRPRGGGDGARAGEPHLRRLPRGDPPGPAGTGRRRAHGGDGGVGGVPGGRRPPEP